MEDFWQHRRERRSSNSKRTEYERDYARVVHSAAFRRLQSKTQVLGMGDSDFNRRELRPPHDYTLEQFGFSEEGLRDQFKDYRLRFIDR